MYSDLKYRFNHAMHGISIYIITLLLFTGFSLPALAAPPTSNLVGYWALNATSGTVATNSAGASYQGTLNNSPTWASGKIGNGLTFDGTDYVQIGNITQINNVSKATLGAWIRRNSTGAVVEIGKQTTNQDFAIEAWSDGRIYFHASKGSWADGYVTLNDTNWHYVVMVFDGSLTGNAQRLKGYIDGTQQTLTYEGTIPSTTTSNTTTFYIGRIWNDYSNSQIDEVILYNRALTSAEVQQLYKDGNTADTQVPTAPGSLVATGTSLTIINTTWSASTDNVAVTGYKVFRNGNQIATTTALSLTDTGLTPNTTYAYSVSAFDAAGNVSAVTGPINATTLADTTPPSISITSPTNNTTTSGTISLTANASDDTNVIGVKFLLDGSQIESEDLSAPYTISWNTATVSEGSHILTAKARDAAGNIGTSSAINITVDNIPDPDTQAPTIPGSLYATSTSPTTATVTWTASTDNVGVAGYKIFRDGNQIATTTALSIMDTGLTQNTTYAYSVSAFDAAGNVSAVAGPVNATMFVPDITAPQISVISVSLMQTFATVTWTTDELSSSNISYGLTSSYSSSVQSSSLVTSHSVTVTNLTANTTYHFQVSSQDGSGNLATSTDATFETMDASYRTYTTNFPATENPISESGNWMNGGTNGLDWTDISTTPGLAIGHQVGASYTDATALLNGTWGPDQTATAAVYSTNPSTSCYPETELRLRSTINAHVNNGYEIGYKVSQGLDAYLIIVRWNGPLGNYTMLLNNIGTQYGVQNGDVISASIVGNVISAYKNGILMGQAIDDTYTTGSPGMGFNLENGGQGCPGINNTYGYTSYTATDRGSTVDMQAPTVPGNLYATSTSPTTAAVTWTASTDNIGVSGYKIFRNGNQIATTTALSIMDTGLTQNTTYAYSVSAFDAAGNVSAVTGPMSATTQISDTTPPVFSSITSSVSETSATITWATNEPSTSHVDYGLTSAYGSSVQSSALVTTHSMTITGLTTGATYHFGLSSQDASANTATSSDVIFNTTTSTSLFPLTISADHRTMVDVIGNPFPILGRTSWDALSLNASSSQTYLDDTKAKGYNAIEVGAIWTHPGSDNDPFDGYGNAPFLKRLDGMTWNGSTNYANINSETPDFTTPNEAYWSNVDAFLNNCERRGIVVLLFPSYVGYAGGDQGWMREMVANGSTNVQTYGTWIANRYKNQKNIIWMMNGDHVPQPGVEMSARNALISGMTSVAGQQSIYFSSENDSNSISSDDSAIAALPLVNGAYSWQGHTAEYGRNAYAYSPTSPSFLLEEPYDEEGSDGNGSNSNATQPVRRFQWWGWLSTIGGYMAGNGYIWPFNTGWQNHLDTQGAQDMARMNSFITSHDWSHLVPSGLGDVKTLVTSGGNSASNWDYVAAAATPSGSLLIAYVPPDHNGPFTIDMTALNGPATASWYDPTSGAYMIISGSPFANTGSHSFTIPGTNSVGQNDWILVLDTIPDTTAPVISNATSSTDATFAIITWTTDEPSASRVDYGTSSYSSSVQSSSLVTSHSVTVTNLTANTTYHFQVSSQDGSGNLATSTDATFKTAQTDVMPPVITAIASSTGIATATITWTTDEPSASRVDYGTSSYSSSVQSSSLVTSHSVAVTNLTANTTYHFQVSSQDGSGNLATSTDATFKTAQAISTPTFVQESDGEGSGTSYNKSFSSNTQPGNLIMISISTNGPTIASLTDSQGNTFTQVGSDLISPSGYRTAVYYAKNITGGADTINISLNGSSPWIETFMTEYAGIDPVNPIDVQSGNSGATATVTSGSLTTTTDGDLLYGMCLAEWSSTMGSGFTTRSTFNSNLVEDRIMTTAGSYAATATADQGWNMQAVALRPMSN